MTTVRTQEELDAALARGDERIDIRSEAGVRLAVWASDSSTVRAYGSSTVWASGSSTVWAYGSATVRAYDSATVRASDSATVRASGSATVRAYDSATVWAYGSSTVWASDSATVRASDSATVRASGSATVWASGSATVTARARVAVHLHSGRAKVVGGVLIDHTREPGDAAAWCEYHGVTTADGIATLFKAVDDKWTTPRGTSYAPGSMPTADDWRDDAECGWGLHFSPSPIEALAYHPEATRFLAVGVAIETLRPIPGDTPKAKAPRVVVACREVDIDGCEVTA